MLNDFHLFASIYTNECFWLSELAKRLLAILFFLNRILFCIKTFFGKSSVELNVGLFPGIGKTSSREANNL